MVTLTRQFIQRALDAQSVWDLGNDILYKLCKTYPGHSTDSITVAKTLFIGRVYAAALERRRTPDILGHAFYLKVARDFRDAKIDTWFLDPDGDRQKAIETHQNLTTLLRSITGLAKRSFASKYLHFHFPEQFFIYDSRASESANKLIQLDRGRTRACNVDLAYADFFARCDQLSQRISDLTGHFPTPREVDKVLLHFEQRTSRKSPT